jgi:hypothetical protein
VKWLDRLLISLNLRKTQPLRMAALEPEAMAGPSGRDDDTLPFIHRHTVTIPLSQIPPRPRPAPPHHLRAVQGGKSDNAMGDPWVPPGPYGAAAAQVENSEGVPAPEQPKSNDGGSN